MRFPRVIRAIQFKIHTPLLTTFSELGLKSISEGVRVSALYNFFQIFLKGIGKNPHFSEGVNKILTFSEGGNVSAL